MAAQYLATGKIRFHPDYAKRRGPSDATLVVPDRVSRRVGEEGGEEQGRGRHAVQGEPERGRGEDGGGKVAFYFPLQLLAKYSAFFPSPTAPGLFAPATPRSVSQIATTPFPVEEESTRVATLGERMGDRVLWLTPHQVRPHPTPTRTRPLPRPPITPSSAGTPQAPNTPRSHYLSPTTSFDCSGRSYPSIPGTPSRFSLSVVSTPCTLRRPMGPRPLPRPPTQPPWVVGKVIDLPQASVEGLAMILDAILVEEGLQPLRSRSVTLHSPSLHRRQTTSPPVSQVAPSESDERQRGEDDTEIDEEVSSITPSSYRASPPAPSSTTASNGSTIRPSLSSSSAHPDEELRDELSTHLQEAYSTAKAYSFALRLIFIPLDLGSANPWVGYALAALTHLPISRVSNNTRLLRNPGGGLPVYVDSGPNQVGAVDKAWEPSPEMKRHSTRSLVYPLSSLPRPISTLLQTHYPLALSKLLDVHTPWEAAKSIALAFFHAPLPCTPFAFPFHPRGVPCDAKIAWQDYSAARWEVRRMVWSWLVAELGAPADGRPIGTQGGPAPSGGVGKTWRTRFINPWDLDMPLREIVGCRICREALVIECLRAIRLQWPGHPANPLFGSHPRSV